jgi:hypothetical protein
MTWVLDKFAGRLVGSVQVSQGQIVAADIDLASNLFGAWRLLVIKNQSSSRISISRPAMAVPTGTIR